MNEKQKIKKIADIITDNFNEQITDLLISYNIQTETKQEEQEKVDEVIKEIIKIYKIVIFNSEYYNFKD